MNIESYIVALLIIAVILMLLLERISQLFVAAFIFSVLTISGILTPEETLAELGNPTIMLYVGAFIIGATFTKAGLTGKVGGWSIKLISHFGTSEERVLLFISLTTAVLSIFLQAMGVQVAMLPIALGIAEKLHISKKKILLAVGFSATTGGMFTLLGNNVTLLAKSSYEAAEAGGTFGFFEISPITIPMGMVLILFFAYIGMRMIRDDGQARGSATGMDPPGSQEVQTASKKQQILLLVGVGVFLLSVLLDQNAPIPSNVAVMILMAITVLSGLMSEKEIFQAINWKIILFTVSLMTIGTSITKVGLDTQIAELTRTILGDGASLRVVVLVLFVVANLLTQFLSNSGTYGMMYPIAIAVATSLSLPLKPLIISICLGCSCAYATPIATPTYPMLVAAGDISFKEFFYPGICMTLITVVAVTVFVPMIWV